MLFIESFLVVADTLVQRLLLIVSYPAVGDFKDALAEKPDCLIVVLKTRADQAQRHRLINKLLHLGLIFLRTPSENTQGNVFSECGSLREQLTAFLIKG